MGIKDLHVHERQEDGYKQPTNNNTPINNKEMQSKTTVTPKATPSASQSKKENLPPSSQNANAVDEGKKNANSSKNEDSNTNNTKHSSSAVSSSASSHSQQQQNANATPRRLNVNSNGNYTRRHHVHQHQGNGYKQHSKTYNNNTNRRSRKNNQNRVGTGASLLNRKERGAVEANPAKPGDDFDFVSSATEFTNIQQVKKSPYPETNAESCYSKDDFFDSISCDTLDKQSGYDTRLRGAAERSLNTETFGAVSLGSGRRGGRRRGGSGRGAARGTGRGYSGANGSGSGRGSRTTTTAGSF